MESHILLVPQLEEMINSTSKSQSITFCIKITSDYSNALYWINLKTQTCIIPITNFAARMKMQDKLPAFGEVNCDLIAT